MHTQLFKCVFSFGHA